MGACGAILGVDGPADEGPADDDDEPADEGPGLAE